MKSKKIDFRNVTAYRECHIMLFAISWYHTASGWRSGYRVRFSCGGSWVCAPTGSYHLHSPRLLCVRQLRGPKGGLDIQKTVMLQTVSLLDTQALGG